MIFCDVMFSMCVLSCCLIIITIQKGWAARWIYVAVVVGSSVLRRFG
jgi:hypothetical protein